MANLQKVIKLTQAQYDTLAAGGTVGSYTGLNDNYIYLVVDTNTYATEDYVDSEIDDLASRINNSYVRYDINSQGLTDTQKSNARTNIGAGTYSKPSTGIPAGDLDAATRATLVKVSNLTVSATNGVSDGTNTYKYTHPSYSAQTAGLYRIGRDSTGHVTIGDAFTIPTKTSDLTNDSGFVTTDTKNTAGSTNDTSKLFLVGAKTQATYDTTYSRNNTYILGNGILVNTTGFSSYDYASTSAGLLNIGVNLLQYTSGSGPASFKVTSSTHGSVTIGETSGTSTGNPHNVYLQKTAGSAYTGSAYLLFPNVGTSSSPKLLATTDDIPDDSNLVHTTGTETITGVKTFGNYNAGVTSHLLETYRNIKGIYNAYSHETPSLVDFSSIVFGTKNYYATGLNDYKITLASPIATANRTLTLPDATGTVAIDENVVHTTGTETIGGEKTFSLGGYSVAFHAFNNNDQHLYIVLDNGGGNGSCIRYNDFNLNNYRLYFPRNSGTLVLDNEVSKNQAHSIVVYDATHNISGKNLSAYTAVETTLGGYPVIIIKTSSSATLTEEQARSYMAAQTGSTFLPVYDYDRPTYTYFIFANGKLYKPQYDTTNGLVLYYLNQIAFASSAAKVTSAEFVQAGYDVTIVITNSSHTSEWTSTIVYDDNPNTHEIGRFSSANGTLTVNTETGLIDITFDGGLVSVPSPTVTSGITVDYGDSGHYRFNIANSGTITFDGIN